MNRYLHAWVHLDTHERTIATAEFTWQLSAHKVTLHHLKYHTAIISDNYQYNHRHLQKATIEQ